MHLKNMTVLVTGASGGIGAAVAESLDEQGAQLILVGRKQQALEKLAKQISGSPLIIVADLNSSEGRELIIQQCIQSGGIDLMINLAGIMDFRFFEQQSASSIEQTITTNLLSPMLLCNRLIPLLKQKPEAAIVNVGSTFGSIGHPGFTTYCASKFGLRGFTEALQRELADTSIRVFYLAPRATDTTLNSFKVNRLNDALGNTTDSPEQVAHELTTLLKSNKLQHYIGWPEKLFIRINALFPSVVHSALVKKIPVIKQFSEQ
jgi:short-subunit dehydrogenase